MTSPGADDLSHVVKAPVEGTKPFQEFLKPVGTNNAYLPTIWQRNVKPVRAYKGFP